jgi:hypothetical protein
LHIVQTQGGAVSTVSADKLGRETGPTDKLGNMVLPGDTVVAERYANSTVENATVQTVGLGNNPAGDSIVVTGQFSGQSYSMPASAANNPIYNQGKSAGPFVAAVKAILFAEETLEQ